MHGLRHSAKVEVAPLLLCKACRSRATHIHHGAQERQEEARPLTPAQRSLLQLLSLLTLGPTPRLLPLPTVLWLRSGCQFEDLGGHSHSCLPAAGVLPVMLSLCFLQVPSDPRFLQGSSPSSLSLCSSAQQGGSHL